MTDPREALVARQREEYGESWDVLVPEVGWTLGRIIESVIEDALPDATPRGVHNHDIDPACPETRLPDGSLRGECVTNVTPPAVKPSVEDVRDEIAGHPIGSGYYSTTVGVDEATEMARAVLALLPGRTEAEVKVEALRGAADALDRDDMTADRWYAAWLRDHAARIARGEGS